VLKYFEDEYEPVDGLFDLTLHGKLNKVTLGYGALAIAPAGGFELNLLKKIPFQSIKLWKGKGLTIFRFCQGARV